MTRTETAARVAAAKAALDAAAHISPLDPRTSHADIRLLNNARRELINAQAAHRAAR